MGFARNVALVTITISSLTFVAFFGRLPVFRKTPIGFLHRLLVLHIPSFLRKLDVHFTNGRVTAGGRRLGLYLMYEKHPLVLIFFLGLVTASAGLFLPSVWGYLPVFHKMAIALVLPLPYIFTYLSARRHPETYVTEDNHASQLRLYPYDRILYFPGKACSTCKFLKPARSKHCSICKTCVARADHHCIWVNNCLGRGNYRWFLALLLSTTVLLAYGAHLAYIVLKPLVRHQYTTYERFYAYTGKESIGLLGTLDVLRHYFLIYAGIALDTGGVCVSGVGWLALLTWPLPLGLLGYHIYLIWAGMTTNESSKWADWRDDMYDGVVFIAEQKENALSNTQTSSETIISSDVGTNDEEPPTSWPLSSRHVLVRTIDGKPPKSLPARIERVAAEGSFRRCWSLGEVENVYDLGFWDNLREALR